MRLRLAAMMMTAAGAAMASGGIVWTPEMIRLEPRFGAGSAIGKSVNIIQDGRPVEESSIPYLTLVDPNATDPGARGFGGKRAHSARFGFDSSADGGSTPRPIPVRVEWGSSPALEARIVVDDWALGMGDSFSHCPRLSWKVRENSARALPAAETGAAHGTSRVWLSLRCARGAEQLIELGSDGHIYMTRNIGRERVVH